MASFSAVIIAALLQIVFRISFFIEQNKDGCSTAPTLASWIFLIAFLDVLLDICIYPVRYMHLPFICQIVAETIVTILLTEFGSLVVWCTIEKVCCRLSKSFLLLVIGLPSGIYYNWENYILGSITTSTSLLMLIYAGKATDHFHLMRKRSLRMCRKINQNLTELWTQLRIMIGKKVYNNCEVSEEDKQLNSEMLYQSKRTNNVNSRGRSRSRGHSRTRKYY